jgi:hypothetical protein
VIVPLPDVHMGMGLAALLVSIPLVLRKIPMNRWYGIRVQRAFLSEALWYDINAYGGKWFFAFGLFLLAFGAVGRRFAPPPTSPWAPVYFVIPLLAIVPALVAINGYAKRLPSRDEFKDVRPE